MSTNIPIYSIAKELAIESNRVISACKTLGISAKGATKRLNNEEVTRIKNYFEKGKNVSEEIVDVNKRQIKTKVRNLKNKVEKEITYFPNRLIAKS